MKKDSFIHGTIVASFAIILIKFLGAFYVIPFYDIVGEEGGTLYSYAYNIYNLFLNISISGIPIAISKIISEYNTLGMEKSKEKSFIISRNIMGILAVASFLIMFVFSDLIAKLILNNQTGVVNVIDVSYSLKAISFCLLIIPFLSVSKGYLQGHKFISIPSTSQIIEQIIRIFVVLVGSYISVKILDKSITIGVCVALFGAFVGGLIALIFIKYKISKNKDKLISENKIENEVVVSTKEIITKIIKYSIPLIIVSAATSLYDSTDLILVIRGLSDVGYSTSDAQVIASIISTWAPKICMLINAVAMGLSVNIIPHMSSLYIEKDYNGLSKKILESINTILFIAIPMCIGIIMLSEPIYTIFYGQSMYGGLILKIVAIINVLASLHITLNMILQGINSYKIVYLNTIIGLLINAIFDIPLIILFKYLGIYPFYGALFATIIGYIISFIIIFTMLDKKIKINYKNIFSLLYKMLIPILAMTLFILLFKIIIPVTGNRLVIFIKCGICAAVSAFIYFIISYKNKALFDVFGEEYIKKIIKKFSFRRD